MLSLASVLPFLGTEAFASALRQALQTVNGHHLPLERACLHGGLPDPQSLRVGMIGQPVDQPNRVVVPVGLMFEERCGAGCGGSPTAHHHLVDGTLVIDTATGDAIWTINESDPPCEF